MRTEIANLDTRLSTQIAEVRSEIGNLESRLIKWIIGTVVTTAGVTVAIAGVVVGSAPPCRVTAFSVAAATTHSKTSGRILRILPQTPNRECAAVTPRRIATPRR